MFGIDFSEILVILVIALVVLGPEKLPKLAQTIGRWLGRARMMARQFREQLEQEASRMQDATRVEGIDLNAQRTAASHPYSEPQPSGSVPAYPGAPTDIPAASDSSAPGAADPNTGAHVGAGVGAASEQAGGVTHTPVGNSHEAAGGTHNEGAGAHDEGAGAATHTGSAAASTPEASGTAASAATTSHSETA
jgi:sec-independent protein translocase protein TatB